MTLYEAFWFFTIYAFLGWVLEVAAHVVSLGKFVNRGFLNGPVCPIYGVGATLVIFCLTPVQENLPVLFIASALLTTVLEFLTGFVLEHLFHTRWWDYSKVPFNIKGYICLKYSLAWGAACVFVMRILHPLTVKFVHLIPKTAGVILLIFIGLLFIADTCITVISVNALNKRLRALERCGRELHEFSDKLGGYIYTGMTDAMKFREDVRRDSEKHKKEIEQKLAAVREARQRLVESRRLDHRRLLNAFPDMRSSRYNTALKQLKEEMKKRIKK